MNRSALCRAVLAAMAIVILGGVPACAQNNRTFVSGHGSDTNPCSLSAPCRSFQHAHDLTNTGGEITVLDPAGYGSVTISKAISIVNDGVGEAGITATSGDGIDINAGPTDVVNLRGLTLVGTGGGSNAVVLNSGATLNIQNCTIREFITGVVVLDQGSTITILDTSIFTPSGTGVFTDASGISIFVDRVVISGTGFDLFGTTGIIANSTVIGRDFDFVPSSSTLLVVNTSFVGPGFGVDSGVLGAGVTYVGGSTFSGNEPAFQINSASNSISSYGNNSVVGGSIGTTPNPVAKR